MRYTEARFREKSENEVYRIYITDSLYCLTQMRGLKQQMAKRYIDVIHPDRNVIEEDRTPEEIIDGITAKLKGLK